MFPKAHCLVFRLYDLAVGDDDARFCRDIPESQCLEQPPSFVCQTLAQIFSKTGDALVDGKTVMPWLLGVFGAPVYLAAGTFALINEFPGATEGGRGLRDLVREQAGILRHDREFQKFPMLRALMISTSLVGPVYVLLAQQQLGMSLDTLGWLVVASGLASALSNTLIELLLLFLGALSGIVLTFGIEAAIAMFLLLAFAGAMTAIGMEEAQSR